MIEPVMKKITVLLVDDHTVVREGLRALLGVEQDIEVIGEAADGREALALAKEKSPEVVVMDVAMPIFNGMEATRQISKNCPDTAVLVLSSYTHEECVQQLLNAGAAGYLAKQTAANELPKAIREVRRGNRYLSSIVAKELQQQAERAANPQLTLREAEVLQLVAEGLSNKQSASELGISIKTIEKHRQQVMNKLNIHETAGLTRYAIANGIVEGPKAAILQDTKV
jgi:DNA-binding NarL/FixJ family response regulator